jgi:hypothetical protein
VRDICKQGGIFSWKNVNFGDHVNTIPGSFRAGERQMPGLIETTNFTQKVILNANDIM